MHNFYAQTFYVKTHPPRGGVKGGKMGRETRTKGLYIGPISSSERSPYVAFSIKGNMGRAKTFSPGLRPWLDKFPLKYI